MGQNITMLVTREFTEVIPVEIIHFFQNGYLVIPIDVVFGDSLIDLFVEYNRVDEIPESGLPSEWRTLLQTIRLLELQTFVIKFYMEHGEMPLYDMALIVKDGQVRKETIRLIDDQEEYYTETILGYFTDAVKFDISPYWNYARCKGWYLQQLKDSD